MAFELSRIDRLYRTYDLAATLPGGGPVSITGVEVALLPVGRNPTGTTPWFAATYADGVVTVLLAGPDADSTGALAVPATAVLWMKVVDSQEVDAVKIERITVLGGGSFTAPASVQALIGIDTDGVPFYDPGGIGTPAALTLDLDGVLYFTP